MKRYPCLLQLAFLFAFVAICGAETPLQTAVHTGDAPWPLEHVALKQSPRVTEGRLENGLRYAIVSHASPPGRISLRLAVTAGSLNENDDERGYAHFVEHMAFNGTTHFPAGELVKFLQRQGAQFGPHINATTSPKETIYKLELPDNSVATLQTGLQVFRDFADGILFQSREVKRERGVILSEERSRHNADETKRLALTDLLYAGTRIPSRQPIGQIAAIEKADAAGLRKFYDAWYRPENMIVVIVGEIDPKQAEGMVRGEFSSLAARGPAREVLPIGEIKRLDAPAVLAVADPVGGFRIEIIKMDRRAPKPVTWGDQLEGLQLQSALSMLYQRLQKLTQGMDSIVSGSSTGVDVEFRRFRKLTVSVSSSPNNWEKTMAIAEQETRRVIEHGFGEEELANLKTIMRQALHDSARSIPTSASTNIVDALLDSKEDEMPFLSTDETLNELLSMVDQLSTGDCQQAFKKFWGEQPPRIFIITAAQFIPAADKVRAAYSASSKVAVESGKADAPVVFQYDNFGPAGTVAVKTYLSDLDLWLVQFANGVRLNLKHTTFENGLARFNLRVGTGGLGEPKEQPGLRWWTGAWLLGGTGKHPIGDFNRIVGGVRSIDCKADDDAFSLNGYVPAQDLPLALKELTALVSDPAFRPDGFRQMTVALHTQMDPLWNTPEGPMQRFIKPTFAGNDPRIGMNNPDETFARTLDELRAWMAPQLASGPIEIAVIGDLDVEATISEVAKTLGALPDRAPKPPLENERKLQFPTKPAWAHYFYGGPNDRPSTLEFLWPVHDRLGASERRRLPMLGSVLTGQLNDQIREKKGATYSPSAEFMLNENYPGLAAIRCTLDVKRQDAIKYSNRVRDLADRLARKGITADELARAKAQYSAAMKGWLTDNNFWLNNVMADAQENPTSLSDIRTAASDISETTIADLNQLAHKYLGADKAFRYIVDPTARMPKKK